MAKPFALSSTGTPGSGKSTEFTRLANEPAVSAKYAAVRFSGKNEVSESRFGPFGILLIMMIRVAEEAGVRVSEEFVAGSCRMAERGTQRLFQGDRVHRERGGYG